ncbi:hypothetical protein CP533_1031 [Ophiocordyceps camponoti-saundersi (nom. inval.)]|nr:hypothetical protein CP533_1031 [Ophiocordyceps camponoti-saundersi (nom. inval.)]
MVVCVPSLPRIYLKQMRDLERLRNARQPARIHRSSLKDVGRLTHYAFDAVLISAFLAGMKRSTGLTLSFKTDKVSGENKEVSRWIDKYLGVGEWVMDQSVAIAGSSGYFERRR